MRINVERLSVFHLLSVFFRRDLKLVHVVLNCFRKIAG